MKTLDFLLSDKVLLAVLFIKKQNYTDHNIFILGKKVKKLRNVMIKIYLQKKLNLHK